MAKSDVRPRMLLVDDDTFILDALKRNLQRDFHVIAMDSGWDALQELSENENVDVIITDLHMPHMSGGQLLDWMAELFPDVPRIVFTGDTAPAELDGILRAVDMTGKIVWSYDAKQDFQTTNSVLANGGSFGSAGPVVAGGMLYVSSGYIGIMGGQQGNVVLAFGVE